MDTSFSLGVVSAAFSSDARVAAQAARAAGFAGAQFDAVSSGLDLTQLSQSGRREFGHLLSSNELELVGLRVELGPKGLGPGGDVERAIMRVERAMETVAGVAPQRPLVCVDLGPLPEPAREAVPRPKITPQQAGVILLPTAIGSAEPEEPARAADVAFESRVDEALVAMGERADRYSALLAFRTELASCAALERALQAADCPWFGVDLDPAAVLRDRWTIEQVLDRLGPLVRHVRGRDAIAGHDRRTRPAMVGQGTTNWAQVLALLDESGYHGWITVDPLEIADRAAAAGVARNHLLGAR